MTTHPSSQNELEYLEVFDFFNYPRVNAMPNTNSIDLSGIASSSVVPSTSSLGSGGDQTPTQPASQQQQQHSRATPAFVIPNPESDWLVFKPPYE